MFPKEPVNTIFIFLIFVDAKLHPSERKEITELRDYVTEMRIWNIISSAIAWYENCCWRLWFYRSVSVVVRLIVSAWGSGKTRCEVEGRMLIEEIWSCQAS
ncbi:hypothetical protein DU508_11690 [Pedobacter chinensis]|uniref:Uncharacterized protein n=1 Tax=Pedobacter chinensis TaxID=2282421 RepID=A0A369PUR5_9SPHI|nr:hypothetical protein DU508_11690 [Pedobacter chinensis]